jgi:acyl carrier protein
MISDGGPKTRGNGIIPFPSEGEAFVTAPTVTAPTVTAPTVTVPTVTTIDGTLEDRIRQHIVDNFIYGGDGRELGLEQSLLETGIVDSTGVLELVFFVEETFGIKVKDEELVPRNFDSIAKLAAYVRQKTAEPQARP